MIKKNIIILGGQGFVAINICKFFLKKKGNFNFILIGNKSRIKNVFSKNEKKKIILIEHDVFKEKKTEKLNLKNAIVICAFLMSQTSNEIFFKKFLNLCKDLKKKGVEKFILLSSIAVYGKKCDVIKNENLKLNPFNSYGRRCILAEKITKKVFNKKNIILRITNTFGPYRYKKSTIEKILYNCIFEKKYKLYNSRFKRTYLHVNSIAQIIFFLLKKKIYENLILNIGNPKYIFNFDELNNKIKKIQKKKLIYKTSDKSVMNFNSICIPKTLEKKFKLKFKNNFDDEIKNLVKYLKKNEK